MRGHECNFCGSEYHGDNRRFCYGCRLTLPKLAELGVQEAADYLRYIETWSPEQYDGGRRLRALQEALKCQPAAPVATTT